MGKHIYVSVGTYDTELGAYFDKVGNPTSLMGYRGESSFDDDFDSFKSWMRNPKKGPIMAVHISNVLLKEGEVVEVDGHRFKIFYNKTFKVTKREDGAMVSATPRDPRSEARGQ